MKKQNTTIADYIEPLNMNGLQGRMLHLPAPKGTHHEMLVIYGHHATLERWWGLAQSFNTYGGVTMPDLPGFGGMDSFYKIGRKPTIDSLADYLAAFVKMHYKRRRVIIVGISFGFLVATRMLQRYPDLTKKVEFVVSAAGFAHHDDFVFSKKRMWLYRIGTRLLSLPVVVNIYRLTCLNPWVLRKIYAKMSLSKSKFAEVSELPGGFDAMMNMEIDLWRLNDLRTHMLTNNEFLRVDNCKGAHVALPVWHVFTKHDQYFNNDVVEQHFRIIFDEYIAAPTVLKQHVVSVLATKKETDPFVPQKLRRHLARTQG